MTTRKVVLCDFTKDTKTREKPPKRRTLCKWRPVNMFECNSQYNRDRSRDVTKCRQCHHFVTMCQQTCMTCCTWHGKSNTCNPSHDEFIAPAMQNAFVRSMHMQQIPHHQQSKYGNTSTNTKSWIHYLCHEKVPSLTMSCQQHASPATWNATLSPPKNTCCKTAQQNGINAITRKHPTMADGGERDTHRPRTWLNPRHPRINRNASLRIGAPQKKGWIHFLYHNSLVSHFWGWFQVYENSHVLKKKTCFYLKRSCTKSQGASSLTRSAFRRPMSDLGRSTDRRPWDPVKPTRWRIGSKPEGPISSCWIHPQSLQITSNRLDSLWVFKLELKQSKGLVFASVVFSLGRLKSARNVVREYTEKRKSIWNS